MENHPLRGQIIATRLANNIVNDMGPNFVYRKVDATGATEAEVASAYVVARECFDLRALMEQIEACNNKIPADVQNGMLFQIRRVVRRSTRWFLRHRNPNLTTIQEQIDFYKSSFDDLRKNVLSYLVDDERAQIEKQIDKLQAQGVPAKLAHNIAILTTLFSALDLADISHETGRKVGTVAKAYFNLGSRVSLHWFLDQINSQPVDNHWQALARAAFREELDWQQRSLTMSMLKAGDTKQDAMAVLDTWISDNKVYVDRWLVMLSDFRTTKTHEFAKFSVALRELMLLNHNCTSVNS